MFKNKQSVLYDEIGRKEKSQQDPPNTGEAHKFLKKLWDQLVDYYNEVELLKKDEGDLVEINI